jgi:hypothetical protein
MVEAPVLPFSPPQTIKTPAALPRVNESSQRPVFKEVRLLQFRSGHEGDKCRDFAHLDAANLLGQSDVHYWPDLTHSTSRNAPLSKSRCNEVRVVPVQSLVPLASQAIVNLIRGLPSKWLCRRR